MVYNNETIRNKLKYYNKKIFIWGGGSNGIFMQYFLKADGVFIDGFIDNQEKYNGRTLVDNIICRLPQANNDYGACIITVSKNSINAVYKLCIDLNFEKIFICDTEELALYRNSIDDETYLSYMWQWLMGTKLNLKNPRTFNEKLQWLKLFDRKERYSRLVDKYEVRKYVDEKIGNQYLIPLIGIYNNFADIDIQKLPSKFILKCTHDSGSFFICRDKKQFDFSGTMTKINTALQKNYYYNLREWPYKNVIGRIICEELLETSNGNIPYDFKIHCFNGHPDFFSVAIDRETDLSFNYYNDSYQLINDNILRKTGTGKEIQLPDTKILNEMFSVASKLSEDIPYCRVDFLFCEQLYFSEITFFPDAGFNPDWNCEQQLHVGNMIHLNEVNGVNSL